MQKTTTPRGPLGLTIGLCLLSLVLRAQTPKTYDSTFIESLKQQAIASVAAHEKGVQEMVDQIFSYGELGFQEFETSKYLSGVLEKEGFKVERGYAGIPTAFVASE